MKTIIILFLTLMSQFSYSNDRVSDSTALSKFGSFFSSKKTETSEIEIVNYGKLQLTIRKEENIYKVGYIYNNEYKFLFETTSLKMISQFKGQDAKLTNLNRVNIAIKGYLVNPTSWFVIQDDKSYHFLRKKGNEIIAFAIPSSGSEAYQVSTYTFTPTGTGDWYTLFSYKEKNGEQGTLILRESDAVISHVSQQYNDLIKLSATQQPERNIVLDEKTGQFTLPDGKSSHIGKITSEKHLRIKMTMAEGVSLQSLLQPVSIIPAKTTHPVEPATPAESVIPAAAVKSETHFSNVNITINYKNESYQIYNSNVKNTSGIFLRSLKDGIIVKISTLSQVPELNGEQLGFSVTEDGILEHKGLIRKIDLHALEEEAKIIPLDANMDNVKWAEESFDDFKEMSSKKNLTVVESRKTIVDKISHQILSGDQTTVILVGEGTDKEDILSEVSKRMPRTWKVLDLDPSRFGSISYAGELQDKVKKLVSASRSTPILWIASDFNNFQGFGATQGSTTDLLNLLSRELSSSANSLFKLVGTCFNTDILYDTVKNPAVLSALEKEQVDVLNGHEVKNYLKGWLYKKYPELQPSDAFFNKLTQSASRIKPVDAEPKRSLSLLEGITRKLKRSNQLKSDSFTESEVDAALTYVNGIDSGLVTLQGRSKKMQDFLMNLDKTVVGHDHIKYEVHSASEIGLAGLHDGRGPMASHYVDGPPGVGKTELAKGVANR